MFTLERRTGDPIDVAGGRLVPVARSVRCELWGRGAIWNRAVGVLIEGGEGLVPIRDRTRHLQVALLGAGLAGAVCLWRTRRREAAAGREETSR